MKLATESRELIERFFRERLEDENFVLPRTTFTAGQFARIVSRILKIQGLTIGPLVLISPALVRRVNDRTTLPRDLIVHEIAHVIQYRKYGFFGFLRKYFGDYLRNLRRDRSFSAGTRHAAYLAIPFEIEARQTAYDFVRWFADRRQSG